MKYDKAGIYLILILCIAVAMAVVAIAAVAPIDHLVAVDFSMVGRPNLRYNQDAICFASLVALIALLNILILIILRQFVSRIIFIATAATIVAMIAFMINIFIDPAPASSDMTRMLISREPLNISADADLISRAQREPFGGYSPLMIAARQGDRWNVRHLIESGSSLTYTDQTTGWSALHVAAGASALIPVGGTEALIELCQSEQSIDVQDNDGRTALMWACASGVATRVKVLLNSGASPIATDFAGRSVLDYTRHVEGMSGVFQGGEEVRKLILSKIAALDQEG